MKTKHKSLLVLCVTVPLSLISGLLTLWGIITFGNFATDNDFSGVLLLLFFGPVCFISIMVMLTEFEEHL